MRILIVNDDGIHADGIKALAGKLKQRHDITVVAPDSERSASAHSITLNRPLRVSKVAPSGLEGIPCYIVDGLPVDCTKIGITHIMQSGVDLVVSGINHGANMGSDVLYSGTVSAALDAVIMGYRAMAVSIASFYPKHLETAAQLALDIIDGGVVDSQPDGVLYNLNVPDLPTGELKGVKVTRQGRTIYEDSVDVRHDPRGNEYIWMAGELIKSCGSDDTDVCAVRDGYASLTPLKYDLTDNGQMQSLICMISKLKFHFSE
jgi:5'-nucleotidase